ncbi:DUF4262 domain-containing protein [Ferrimonas balearica]|uniref:DUF4262 domain-containing protein n=1 Tax=Ferrimonas balearica TaxID=44012 RepID=UPI001C99B671|nr:DUF4262 domain-containing protein [Ferrimonas balearica]MBY5991735.1 DUF4262 domain-containing protein [Ferrimonas balearica]
MDEEDLKALDDIEKYGCHILGVMEGDGEPRFSYSIGINKQQDKPDLIVVGLKPELSHSIINNYKDRLLSGETFVPGYYYSGLLEGFDVCFVEVDKSNYKNYLGWGLWLHKGDDFKVLQLIWPTTNGQWPWDKPISKFYEWAQPILSASGTLREI